MTTAPASTGAMPTEWRSDATGRVAGIGVMLLRRAPGLLVTRPDQVQVHDAALVLGAGVLPDGRPSRMLRQRVVAAAELWAAGRVRRVLLSGDGESDRGHDEVAVMSTIASPLMDAAALLHDREGRSTWASCRRAVQELGLSEAVVVTQAFHAPRAAYLAARAGLHGQALGLPDQEVYGRRVVYPLLARELVALPKAVIESHR